MKAKRKPVRFSQKCWLYKGIMADDRLDALGRLTDFEPHPSVLEQEYIPVLVTVTERKKEKR